MDLLALLQRGDVAGFNEARDRGGRIELFAEELAELKLVGVDLSGANLDKSDFTGSDLTEANLVMASLADIDGTKAIFDGVLAMRVRMRDAWLEEADLTGADVSHGDLGGAVLNKTKGEALRGIGTRFKEAELKGAVWPLADLSEGNLKGADLTGADLTRAKLTETKMGGATLENAVLDGIDAEQVKLGGSQCKGASFVGARMVGATFAGADLTGAILKDADLSRSNLAGATLTGADLTNCRLADACLDDVDLSDATLDGADLTGLDAAALGLDEAAIEALAAHGAKVDPDAPVVLDEVATALHGEAVGLLWLNPDSPESQSLRWAVSRKGGAIRTGILPVNGNGVLFHTVVAVPDGFRLVALSDRADGAALISWPVSLDGTMGRARTTSLGYEPMVRPVVRSQDGVVLAFGLARRGPTIVIHKDALDGEGFQLLGSEPRAQARGYLGRTHPVMLCKGGVVMTVDVGAVGAPMSHPDGFPPRVSAAAPGGEGIIAVWNTPERGRDPGGLRVMDLGQRGQRDPDVLTEHAEVNGLDALPDGDGVFVAWTEDEGPDGGRCLVARLPGTDRAILPLPHEPLDQVRLLRDGAGGEVRVAVTSLTGRVFVSALDGTLLADVDEQSIHAALVGDDAA